MQIFPAIDLLDGKVVRLFQGDYEKKQVFGDDPLEFVHEFVKKGARCLHLVDLDGAKDGQVKNFDLVRRIKSAGTLFTELGGGIRDEETMVRCFESGVERVILGTAALSNSAFTKEMVKKYGDRIAVGVDARDGKVAVEGWLKTSDVESFDFCLTMRDIGVEYIIYTDISRDGAQLGTNIAAYERLMKIEGVNFTASGGISTLEEIEKLRDLGMYGAILGKALYSGAIDLAEAIKMAAG